MQTCDGEMFVVVCAKLRPETARIDAMMARTNREKERK
jgi:hypothetical protein